METGRSIYYAGNTVAAPQPGRDNLRRRSGHLKDIAINDEVKPMTVEEKVCATSQCVWCGTEFEQESIRCRVCGNCQYCGMFCVNASYCIQCGNKLPDELKQNRTRRVVRFP